jgi:hypothetical protein
MQCYGAFAECDPSFFVVQTKDVMIKGIFGEIA